MPAIRLLDTEHQTELAYLHEQLIEGEPVQDKSWRYAEEYLMQLGIYNVILVEENDVRNYKRFLLEDRDCTIRAANSMTSFLRNKKAYFDVYSTRDRRKDDKTTKTNFTAGVREEEVA